MLLLVSFSGCQTLDWIEEQIDDYKDSEDVVVVDQPAEVVVDTDNDSDADAFPYSSLKWGSTYRKPNNPTVEGSLTINKVTKDNIYFSTSSRNGYPTEQDGGTIDGRCYIFNADGSGGFFDSIRPNQQSRDFKNVKSGYCKGFEYVSGETCYFFIGSIKLNKRNPIAKAVMQ
jgi:hypothetical protein